MMRRAIGARFVMRVDTVYRQGRVVEPIQRKWGMAYVVWSTSAWSIRGW